MADSFRRDFSHTNAKGWLDMGCGKAVSSIFLAKEFHVQVWATDLWIKPGENWQRIREAGLEDRVFPIHAEAHNLPFAEKFFDAAVSLDAYHYFGTDDLYMDTTPASSMTTGRLVWLSRALLASSTEYCPIISRLTGSLTTGVSTVQNGGKIIGKKQGRLEIKVADMVPEGWRHWLRWLEVCGRQGGPTDKKEIAMLRSDEGRNLGFTRILARKKGQGRGTDWLDMIPGSQRDNAQ